MRGVDGKVIPTINEFKEYDNNGNGGGNPNHDPKTGRFTFGPGGKATARNTDKVFSSEILNKDGVGLDVEHDLVYLDDSSHKSDTIAGETRYYDWGSVQFGTPGHKDGKDWSDKFAISGNHRKEGEKPSSRVQITSEHAYDDAEYHWAVSYDKKQYDIIKDGKKVGSYKAKVPDEAIKGDRIAVPCELLERLTELNKGVKPDMLYD